MRRVPREKAPARFRWRDAGAGGIVGAVCMVAVSFLAAAPGFAMPPPDTLRCVVRFLGWSAPEQRAYFLVLRPVTRGEAPMDTLQTLRCFDLHAGPKIEPVQCLIHWTRFPEGRRQLATIDSLEGQLTYIKRRSVPPQLVFAPQTRRRVELEDVGATMIRTDLKIERWACSFETLPPGDELRMGEIALYPIPGRPEAVVIPEIVYPFKSWNETVTTPMLMSTRALPLRKLVWDTVP